MGAEYIIDDVGFGDEVCATNKEMFDVILLHKLPGLDFSQTAEHFPKLIQRYKIWIAGKIVLIEFSAFHIVISLSKKLSLRMQPAVVISYSSRD